LGVWGEQHSPPEGAKMPKVIRLFLPLLFVISAAVFSSWWARPQTAANPNIPASLRILFLPYYSVKGDWDSKLTLNNSLPQPLTASATLYSLKGNALALPDFSLSSSQSITLLLSDLVRQAKGSQNFQEGSIELRFTGVPGALGPQLTVYDLKHGLSFDVEPAGGFRSSTLEGLWWSLPDEQESGEDEKTSARVMLANTTNQDIKVLLNLEWRGGVIPGPPISMSPHQTVVIEIDKLLDQLHIHRQGIERGGLSLSHNGSPGALIAHGVILNRTRGFASNLNFVDPAAQSSSVLEATGLLLAHPDPGLSFSSASFFSPILALKNASSSAQTATVTVQYAADGRFQTQTLPPMNFAPHDVRFADFSSLLDSLRNASVQSAGLKVEFAGTPGSLIGALSSIDQSGSAVVDAPLFNVDPKTYRAGNHPFHIGGNSQTVAYVKNIGTVPTTAIMIVRFPGGEFTPPLLKLGPGETLTFDLRQLRDSRAKDIHGRNLPEDLTEGQFIWYPHGREALIGRAVLLDTSVRTASNFSCSNCCAVNFDHLEHSPFSISSPIGSSQQIVVNEFERESCTQSLLGPYDVTSQCQFSSSNTSVATASPSGMVNIKGVGSTTVTFVFPNALDTQYNGFDCVMTVSEVSDSCPVVSCAIPTNFSLQSESNLSDGSLFFTYTWSSSTGNQADLAACTVGESVFYPGSASPYIWPLPMVQSTANPTVVSGPATSAGFQDTNGPPGSYQQPYSSASFQATQRFWWTCPCYNNGNLQYFGSDVTIIRKVFRDTDGFWKYQITKSGYTNTVRLPNQ